MNNLQLQKMKSIKNFFRKLDLSGLPFTFKYKSKDRYTTSLGGFILILFSIVVLYFGIYYFIEFINMKNFTIIYYTASISKTEIFVNYTKVNDDIYNKNKTILSTHYCTPKDFFNEHNESFDILNADRYLCLDNYNNDLVGIFSDKYFTYYEFIVKAKEDTAENLNNIEEYLFENECKLKIAYIDKAVDLDNYKNPITSCLNEVLIQLNPTLFIKRNMFFMNQHLADADDIFGLFSDSQNTFITSIYSRYDEYFIYVGLNRSITKAIDYLNYGKIFLRADTKKTEIRRTYQNLFEFYANISSLLIGVFRVLVIILSFFNNFFAEASFSNKIFIFKEFENKKFNINKRYNQINKIKSLLNNCNLNETENSSFDSDINDFK